MTHEDITHMRRRRGWRQPRGAAQAGDKQSAYGARSRGAPAPTHRPRRQATDAQAQGSKDQEPL